MCSSPPALRWYGHLFEHLTANVVNGVVIGIQSKGGGELAERLPTFCFTLVDPRELVVRAGELRTESDGLLQILLGFRVFTLPNLAPELLPTLVGIQWAGGDIADAPLKHREYRVTNGEIVERCSTVDAPRSQHHAPFSGVRSDQDRLRADQARPLFSRATSSRKA